jgi:hypothetical protein
MKHLIIFAAFLSGIGLSLTGALTDEEIIRLMDEEPAQGYNIDPTEYGLPSSSSGFIILNYDDTVIDGVWRILENPEQQKHWKQAFRSLRRIATADSQSVDYNRLVEQIKKIEKSESIDDEAKIDLLMLGYPSVARHRNDQAFEFLKARTRFEFWKDHEISSTVYNSHGAGSDGILQTGQSMAINAIPELQTEEAYELLQSLFADERYTSKQHLNTILSSSLEYGGWGASASRLQTIQSEYAKRLELRGEKAPAQVIDDLTAKISATPFVPEVEEIVQEAKQPEPATEKKFDIAIAQLAEDSSNWWLWLIGAVVVVGGVLFIRSKNERLK